MIINIIFRKRTTIFLTIALSETMKAQGYNHHILPILDEFFEQNQKKCSLRTMRHRTLLLTARKRKKLELGSKSSGRQTLRILTTLKIYGVA